MKYKSTGIRISTELLDKSNNVKNKYKQKPMFDLIDFTWSKSAGYYWLQVVVTGDLDGREVLVYQIDGKPVELEKINTLLYRYRDPEDETSEIRYFETDVAVSETERKKKQLFIQTEPNIYFLTSAIYALNVVESMGMKGINVTGRSLTSADLGLRASSTDELSYTFSQITGTFKIALFQYDMIDSTTLEPDKWTMKMTAVSGVLRELLRQYAFKEENVLFRLKAITGILRQLLIIYNYYAPENTLMTFKGLNGTFVALQEYHENFINANSPLYNPTDSDNGVTIIERTVSSAIASSKNDQGVAYKPSNTSVLDFENGLTDRVNSNVTWSKEGTGDLTAVNKLYGSASFEVINTNDRLYTTSNVISGGSTPYTLEFDALVKGDNNLLPASNYLPLYTDNENISNGNQGLFVHKNTRELFSYRQSAIDSTWTDRNISAKIYPNEINRYKISYDGSALRYFLNDTLVGVVGDTIGHVKKNNLSFLDNRNTGTGANTNNTKGILDNIIISDGIATKVRNTDENEGSLIVDLAFDGETNSTFIKDNGTLGLTWNTVGAAKLNATQPFDGYSSLDCPANGSYIEATTSFSLDLSDFTINTDVIFTNAIGTWNAICGNFDNTTAGTWSLWRAADGKIVFSTHPNQFITSNTILQSNISYNLKIVRKFNMLYLYINDKLDASIPYNSININASKPIRIGFNYVASDVFNGYIKNFKVYKGVGIFPKSSVGKIQLNFNNNFLDTYKNTTWTNSGVTFDNVNSVEGYSSYFNGSATVTSTNTTINFRNHYFSFDINPSTLPTHSVPLSVNGHYLYVYIRPAALAVELYNSGSYITGYSFPFNFLTNKYHQVEIIFYNSKIYYFINSVLIGISNNDLQTFTSVNNSLLLGRTTNGNYAFNGYLDNFKSYRDDLLGQTINYLPPSGTTANIQIVNDSLDISFTGTVQRYCTTYLYDSPILKNFTAEVELQIKTGNTNYGGLIFRTPDYSFNSGDCFGYQAYITGTYIRFGKGSNSSTASWTQLASQDLGSYADDKFHVLRVEAKDSNFKIYLDNNLIFNVTDATYNYSSKFGLPTYYFNTSISSRHKRVDIWDESGIKVYHLDWKSKLLNPIVKPAVHLPLETNSMNVGFTPITITEVGSPSYQTISGKKCIKFETGKYLSIDSNNIFNFGTSSDFYFELNYFITEYTNQVIICSAATGTSSNLFTLTTSSDVQVIVKKLYMYINNRTLFNTSNEYKLNEWNLVKVYRNGTTLSISLNGVVTSTQINETIDFSFNGTRIGANNYSSNPRITDYVSNFKMFVGTSEPPINFNDKGVLDLDFSPTRKSYLFEDKFGKCVLQPINITQRDYQNSEYCCTFDGTDRRIAFGKNSLLNFGVDDYVLYIRFKVTDFTVVHQRLISDNYSTGSAYSYVMITGDSYSNPSLTRRLFIGYDDTNSAYSYSTSQLEANTIYDAVFVRSGNTTNTYINGKLEATLTSSLPFNLNYLDNTYIGGTNPAVPSQSTQLLKGTIYKIKAYRNTTDTSVLNLPILNTPSNVYLPLSKDIVDIKGGSTWTNNASRVVFENEAAKFDGNTLTYLTTGTAPNLVYGTDDFTIGLESFKTGTQTEARLIASNVANPSNYPRTEIKHSTAIGLALSNYTSSPEVIYKSTKSGDLLNNWYKSKFTKTGNTIFTYINESLVDISSVSNGVQFSLNTNGGSMIGGALHTTSTSYDYAGYIKNIYSNNLSDVTNIMPYIYLPYDTALSDLGINNLAWTNISNSAVLDTVNNVKCTKVTSNSANPSIAMVLGHTFVIKAKIYIPFAASSGYKIVLFGTGWNSNVGFSFTQFTSGSDPQIWLRTGFSSSVATSIAGLIGTWIDVVISKTLTEMILTINGNVVGSIPSSGWNVADFEASKTFYIGNAGDDWKEASNFYIRDFKYYKGISTLPTTESISKKVLYLKGTKDDRRVYPFKDEMHKQVISQTNMNKYNLVNIEGTDCIQFNGLNQYLELGQNRDLDLTNEDFVIAFKLYLIPYTHISASQWQIILGSGSTGTSGLSYVAYDQSTKSFVIRANNTEVYRLSNVLKEYAWNTVIITRQGTYFNATINGVLNNGVISSTNVFNLNHNNNTYIGSGKWNTSDEFLKGYLTDLQIIKGSSDITLIDSNTTETVTIVNPPKNITYPLVMNNLDSFGTNWYQSNTSNPVVCKEYTPYKTSMYFDGTNGIYSNNLCYRIGLSKFTFECDIMITSIIDSNYPMHIFSYGRNYNLQEWYALCVTNTGVLRFISSKGGSIFVNSAANLINYNTKYNIAVTRDENFVLRMFVNGVKVVEQSVTTNFDSWSNNSGSSYPTYTNYLYVGRDSTNGWNNTNTTYGFKGHIDNFHYVRGVCKYTDNYTPSVNENIKIETKSLLNVSSAGSPSTVVDSYYPSLVWNNSGCNVIADTGLRPFVWQLTTTSNRIIGTDDMFLMGVSNWTLDLILKPTQTNADTVILDLRPNSTVYRGLVITQPTGNVASLTFQFGSSTAATAFDATYNTGANTFLTGLTYHVRVVKCSGSIFIFMNGVLKTTLDYGTRDIGSSNRLILGNNDTFTKGFTGTITQFRFLKGIASDAAAFTNITEELK